MNWNPFRKKKAKIEENVFEKRQTLEELLISGAVATEDVSKEQVMNIPSVVGCIEVICNTIASIPIQLYKEKNGKVELVPNDPRTTFLNDDTGDILDGVQFKRAIIEDYLLMGAGYAYINRSRNAVKSLHYVANEYVGVNSITDPIFKKSDIHVNGVPYREWEFIKITRQSKNGMTGQGIIKESNEILAVVYNAILFEKVLVSTGGNKKGFLKASGRLSSDAITELKNAWNNLYKTNSDSNVVILNNGLDFQEASLSSVEMQLNEHKKVNAQEICNLFCVPYKVLTGEASENEYDNFIKTCIQPILTAFECALNKDLLLPSEKESFYFAFDTNELMKADVEKRYRAYQMGVQSGLLQIDEVRYKENLPPLGLNWIKLGLQDVLYKPDTEQIYTPNTNQLVKLGEPSETPAAQVPNGQTDPNANQNPDNNPPNPADNKQNQTGAEEKQ